MSNDQLKANFKSLYKHEVDYDYDDGVISFKSCDSKYKINIPKFDKDIPTKITLTVIHVRGLTDVQGDDVGTLKMTFDSDGAIADFDPKIQIGEDHLGSVLGWVGFGVATLIAIVPLAVGAAATCGAILAPIAGAAAGATALLAGSELAVAAAVAAAGDAAAVTLGGVSAAALSAPVAVVATGAATVAALSSTLLAEMSSKMINWSDDGGRIHFPQVLAHATARLQIAMMETRLSTTFTAAVFFDKDKWFDVVRDADTDDFDDRHWAKDNTALEYKYKGESYRTWLPDVTVTWSNTVVIVSFKIDCDRNNKTDDHTLVLIALDMKCRVICAQAAMSMKNEETLTIAPIVYDVNDVPVKVPSTVGKTVVAAGGTTIESALNKSIDGDLKEYDGYKGWSDQRKRVPAVVQHNINWIQKSFKKIKT